MNLENQNLAQVSQELTTIRDYIRWAYSRFRSGELYYGHGMDNPWDEAVHLVLSALHLPPDITPDLLNAQLTLVERRCLCEFIYRRVDEKIPTAYLTKEAWFAGLPFYVDQRVLIPRSPLAELIEKEFHPWLGDQEVESILDLCTGSGCIAIACALAFPESRVDASDVSKDALAVAQINVHKHHLEDQVRLVTSNLFENIFEKYSLIVSNPPYVANAEYANLPTEYRFEPQIGLEAKEDGLEIVKQILSQADQYLLPDGILVVEVGNSQEALLDKFPEVPFTWIEFERGGDGVFVLTEKELKEYKSYFSKN